MLIALHTSMADVHCRRTAIHVMQPVMQPVLAVGKQKTAIQALQWHSVRLEAA